MSDKPPLPPLPANRPEHLSKWRHRNGTVYTVIIVGREEATLTPVVVYAEWAPIWLWKPNGDIWTRPLSEFMDGRFTQEV
jgi:hypothetical protein